MDDLGSQMNDKPHDQHPDVTGGSNTDPSVSLQERRERSRVNLEVPGFQTMRLVSAVGRSLADRPERPAYGELLSLIRRPSYDELRQSLEVRFAVSSVPNPLLETLSSEGRKVFDQIKTEFSFKCGDTFELDSADRSGFYIIEKGRIELIQTYPERSHQHDTRSAGDFFGEGVLLDGMRRVTVDVLEDTKGVWIPANRFVTLIEAEPTFLMNLTRIVLRHQSEQDNKLIEALISTKVKAEKTVERLNAITTTSEAINSAEDLDQLLHVILREARRLVRAERGTVYLVDRNTSEIYSFVNEKGHRLKFSLPFGQGFAGLAAEHGITINIEDAYNDPRFHPDVDQETGFRTRSVLTMPIKNPKGDLVGVIQLLNKLGEGVFSTEDEEMLATFGIHAAIAIDRTLTAEAMMRNNQLAVVGNLAASIVHDLKAPLTVIQGYVDLLNYTLASEDQRAHIERISKQLRRMVGMTQEVLDFSRGEIRLNPSQTKVNEYLTDICDSFANEMKTRNIDLVLESSGIVSDWNVILDQDRFARVLTNLITNAREAMPEGGTITLGATRYDKYWELQISDTGIGIPADRLDTIFDPFTTHGKKNGTGLGLSIARNVVDEHGGVIHIDSKVGVGTTVSIQMPVRPRATSTVRSETMKAEHVSKVRAFVGSCSSSDTNQPSMN